MMSAGGDDGGIALFTRRLQRETVAGEEEEDLSYFLSRRSNDVGNGSHFFNNSQSDDFFCRGERTRMSTATSRLPLGQAVEMEEEANSSEFQVIAQLELIHGGRTINDKEDFYVSLEN